MCLPMLSPIACDCRNYHRCILLLMYCILLLTHGTAVMVVSCLSSMEELS